MNEGFVKLWRSLDNNPVLKDQPAIQLLTKFWLKASYQDDKYHCIFNNKDRYLKRGQVFFSRREWAEQLSGWSIVSEHSVERALRRLCDTYQITSRETSRDGTIVTLLNWDRYQSYEDSKRAATRAAIAPQSLHNQKRKNEINKTLASQAPRIEIHNHINQTSQAPQTSPISKYYLDGEVAAPPPEWRQEINRIKGL